MPLAAQLPVIDNRTFDDIVAEAQTRIPRYTPEWTDFNAGRRRLRAGRAVRLDDRAADLPARPGADAQLHQVPPADRHRADAGAAGAGRAGVPGAERASRRTSVPVPARTQVSRRRHRRRRADRLRDQTRDHRGAGADGRGAGLRRLHYYTDVTADNVRHRERLSALRAARQRAGRRCSSASIPRRFPGGRASCRSRSGRPRTAACPPPLPCGGGASPVYAPAQIVWEYWAGTAWQPLKLLSDDTLAFTHPGFVQVLLPAVGLIVPPTMAGARRRQRAWLRARLAAASYEAPPTLALVSANAVAALAAQTVLNEVLGGSNGAPNQTFTLSSTPVLDGTLELTDRRGQRPGALDRGRRFCRPRPERHGLHARSDHGRDHARRRHHQGHIPVANLTNPSGSIVAASYQFGGGARTNIAAGTALTLMTEHARASIPATSAMPFAAYGGSDEETLQSAMNRAPAGAEEPEPRGHRGGLRDCWRHRRDRSPRQGAAAVHPDFPGMSVPASSRSSSCRTSFRRRRCQAPACCEPSAPISTRAA